MPSLASTAILPATLTVRDKFTGDILAELEQCSVAQVTAELDKAHRAAEIAARLPRHLRGRILDGAAASLEADAEHASRLIVAEAGKTIRQARKEVARAVNTLRLSAVEARRNAGEVVPFDAYPGSASHSGWFTREPLGLIAAITPYNDALNLVAHKLGPAIAGGNPVVLKPSQLAPLSARYLVDLLRSAGLPDEVITVVHGNREVVGTIVSAPRVRMVSFTGGFRTAAAIAAKAGIKRLAMELGGNSPVLVFDDADLERSIAASVSGAFWAAGQNCIGVQRILVQRPLFEAYLAGFAAATSELVVGDPSSELTDVGPMISAAAAADARNLITDAVAQGAELVTGGDLDGPLLAPAVLTAVPHTCRLWRQEAFAPVVSIEPFDHEEQAIAWANQSDFALQAGVFTSDLNRALRVSRAIEAGGVMINDSSDFRFDAMPFGGAKFGSMGREGVRFAYEEMTQPKVVAIAS